MNEEDVTYSAGGDLFVIPKMDTLLKKFNALAARITLSEVLVLQINDEGYPMWVPITDVEFVIREANGLAN